MKTLERYCGLILLILTSASLEAKPTIPNAVVGIGSFYQQGLWGEQLSLGVQFDAVTSSQVEYQHQTEGERLALTIDRQFPLSEEIALVASAGSTAWLGDKQDKDVTFEPLVGIGIRYDWSRYVATVLSYQHVLSNESHALLDPSVALGLVFRPFYQPAADKAWTEQESKTLSSPKASTPAVETASCEIGTFLRSFYFVHDQGETEIEREQVAQLQLEHADRLTLIGHTDASGEREYNQLLGLRRAQYVEQALVKQGVNAHAITVCSRGEEGATRQKSGADDWMFRRVDVYLND